MVITDKDTGRFWDKVNAQGTEQCWVWGASVGKTGYGQFKLGRKVHRAHRVAWMLEYGTIPEGMYVLHRCDNPSCVNPRHLFLGNQQDNMDDMCSKGRQSICTGEQHPRARLTQLAVRIIRIYYPALTCPQLGAVFNVSHATIRRVVKYETWAL